MKISIETKLRFYKNEDRELFIKQMRIYSGLVKYGIKCLKPQNNAKKEVYKILTEKFPNLPARAVTIAVEQDISATINSMDGLEAKNFPLTMRFDKNSAEFFVEDNMIKVKMAIDRPEKGKLIWITANLMPKRCLTYKYYKLLFSSQKGYKLPFRLMMRSGQIYAKITVEKETLLATSTKPHINVGIDLNAYWVGKRELGNPMAVAFLKDDNSFARQPLLIQEWAEIPKLIRKTQRDGAGTKKVIENQLGLIIKKLLDLTKDYQVTFKLENLKGLNKLKGGQSKFSYHKLLDMLETKSLDVQVVNPAYTSQTCSKCGKLGRAEGRHFSCGCGYQNHRDINASINIAKLSMDLVPQRL